ncbi:VIR protein [Plasmodium vivax]|uniref:VIR protein n=1 Tax=Plasmodium vivax TaxID=5855 RepID=A0A1G4E8L1_PLAVI|nr:VIR protein [Plasmodium vivax]
MEENIYNVVNSYSEYETILGNYDHKSSSADANCTNIIREYSGYNCYQTEITCKNAIYYMNELKKKEDDVYIANGCIYLYYSLYDMMHKKGECSGIINKFYKSILVIFDEIHNTKLSEIEINFNADIYEKLKNLHNLYKYLHKYSEYKNCNNNGPCDCAEQCIKIYERYIDECNRAYYTPFCRELQKFGENFNDTIKQNNRCNGTVKLLPIFSKYNFEIIILIPIVVLLFACSLLFIFYKFFPYGSYINTQKTKKKNMVNKLKQSHNNILQGSEYEKRNHKNRPYNISYKYSEYS